MKSINITKLLLLAPIFTMISCSNKPVELITREPTSERDHKRTYRTAEFEPGFYHLEPIENTNDEFLRYIRSTLYVHPEIYYRIENDTLYDGIRGVFADENFEGTISSKMDELGIPQHQWSVTFKNINYNGICDIIKNENGDLIFQVFNINTQNRSQFKMNFKGLHLKKERTLYIAHRGAEYYKPQDYSGLFAANTLEALDKSILAGFEGFEFDVRVTKDKQMIVSHDDNLDIPSDCKGSVSEKNLDELTDCMVDRTPWIPEMFGKKSVLTSKMPTLKQVFERYLNNPKVKVVMVDIKPASDEDIYQGIFKAAMEIPNNKETNKKLYFLSRTNKSLELLKKRFPEANFALEGPKGDEPIHDFEKWIPEVTGNKRQSHNAISLSIGMLFVKKVKPFKINEFVKLAHKHHYSVAGWTISRERKLIRVANKIPNLDMLLTDKDRSEIATIQLKRHFKLKD